jgi:hypothetical protein
MGSENITQILPPPKKRAAVVAKIGLHLSELECDEFSSVDLVNGLHGVCVALDEVIVDGAAHDLNHACHLAMAAKVLSSLVQDRLVLP